jgi:hypothetical protein
VTVPPEVGMVSLSLGTIGVSGVSGFVGLELSFSPHPMRHSDIASNIIAMNRVVHKVCLFIIFVFGLVICDKDKEKD